MDSRAARLRRRRAARRRGFLAFLLVGAGAATTAYPALAYGAGALGQARLAAEVRTLLGPEAPSSTPTPRLPATGRDDPKPRPAVDGQALGIVEVPSVGISAVFLEGVSDQTLMAGPGHLPWTAPPGSDGVSVLAGHRDVHFRSLKDVAIGSRVILRIPGQTIAYRVTARAIVYPDAAWVTVPKHRRILRLVTCWPPNFFGHAPQRLVVSAVPVSPKVEPQTAAAPSPGKRDAGPPRPAGYPSAGPSSGLDLPVGPLPVSVTAGAVLTGRSLLATGAVGAALAAMAAFGAWRTRRRLLLWLVPWVAGLTITALVLAPAWSGVRILPAG